MCLSQYIIGCRVHNEIRQAQEGANGINTGTIQTQLQITHSRYEKAARNSR